MHCQMILGVIQEPCNLPISFANVSNFNCLPNAVLADYGWYPFMTTAPPIINPAVQKLTERRTFGGIVVLQSWSADTMTAEEALAYATATMTDIANSIDQFLDQAVKVRSYNTIVSAKGWFNSSNPNWATDAIQATTYSDLVWNTYEALKAALLAGTAQVPTNAAFFAQFPPLWTPSNGNGPLT